MSVYVVRAFVQFRAALGAHPQLAAKLAQLEQSLARLARDTQQKVEEVYEAIRTLASAPTLSPCAAPAIRGGGASARLAGANGARHRSDRRRAEPPASAALP